MADNYLELCTCSCVLNIHSFAHLTERKNIFFLFFFSSPPPLAPFVPLTGW